MGRTWKSVILAVVVNLATISPAQGQPKPLVADAGAQPVPQADSSRPANRDDSQITDADGSGEILRPNAIAIFAYVAGLELLLAVIAAIACLLALVLAAVVARRFERSASPAGPARIASPESLILISAKKLLA
jgi:hypothetical protein